MITNQKIRGSSPLGDTMNLRSNLYDGIKLIDLEVGTKVTYISHNKKEYGIVKSWSIPDHVFVVYKCDNNWGEYSNYTGARTAISDLLLGWK